MEDVKRLRAVAQKPTESDAKSIGSLITRRAVLSGMSAPLLVGCAAPEHLVGLPAQGVQVSQGETLKKHRIMIATTRAPSQDEGVFYSGARSQNVNLAMVDVTVPQNHKAGQVERPRSLPPDPSKHFTIQNPKRLDRTAFENVIRSQLKGKAKADRKLMIWVHGYNTTLSDALLRVAQFLEDTGYQGVPILYSWASAGKVTKYVYDINSALAARDGLATLAEAIVDMPVSNVDVVAHSMGNLLVMETIRGQGRVELFNTTGKISNIILASPDIDIDLFATHLRGIPKRDRGFYVLVSSDDQALKLSELIASGERVGQVSPDALTALGVNVIDLSQVSDPNSNHHSKFADAPEVVRLIGSRMLAGDTFSNTAVNGVGEAISVGASGALQALD